ncbi:recombinase family protein [Rhizorhabdus wittichii]|uniref:Recombinase family protein n=1 Tax=Rhizorhabdus wittichii TaxID=160791 RepID=A0A975D2A6_9SPHN|nr:recombinase family protein [Rhizorhabdus wittichii]QTH21588.1 recombinase family protein [Rhizorhabdus wittichii]
MSRGRAPEPQRREKIRCAIYTRKSTEEGLDQEFNSLDAQREACAAYIMSQRHEGWTLVPDYYDDGGFTGGNMDRPGLKQLLADVEAGKVDVIVVYKVDRLTRALSDFAKIVDVLDAAGASFVSITQSFNTTTSMGRLTLNVLLSFAQFEREVISERVRDKVAASKRKGMWMGGNCPLGYDIQDRKLVVNEAEAETVRYMMRRYLELGSVYDLAAELRAKGVTSKVHRSEEGKIWGGKPIVPGALYHILGNELYRGVVVHKGEAHPGEHEAIIDDKLWTAVQDKLASNRIERRHQANANEVSLLAGMIRDGEGRRMTPSHASRGDVRYRYYNSVNEGEGPHPRPIRIAARDIEKAIVESLERLIGDRAQLTLLYPQHGSEGYETANLLRSAALLHRNIPTIAPSDQRALLLELSLQVIVHADRIEAKVGYAALGERLGVEQFDADREVVELSIPTLMVRRGTDVKLTIQFDAQASSSRRDPKLVELIVKAHQARRMLGLDGKPPSLPENLGYRERSHIARLARLSFLAPDIVRAVMEGTQPASLQSKRLYRMSDLPMNWDSQKTMLGFS